MKINVTASDFQQAIQKAFTVIPAKTTLALLECLELKISEGLFTVRSTDMELQFQQEVYSVIKNKKESAYIIIPADKFASLINSIDSDEEISLDITDKGLSLKTSKAKYNFTAQEGGELPNLAKGFTGKESFKIGAGLLKGLISNTLFAVTSDRQEKQFNVAMSGLNIKAKGNTVTLCGTSGKILATTKAEIANEAEFDIVIPANLANLILKSFNDEEITVSLGEGQVQIDNGMITINSRLIDEPYVMYQPIIDSLSNKKILTCKKTELLSALKRIGIFSDFDTKAVTINLTKNSLQLVIADAETGSDGLENVESVYEDEDFSITINANYLLANISHVDCDRVKMSFGEPKKAVIIESLEPSAVNFFSLAMPRSK